jgi:hypothetical protein
MQREIYYLLCYDVDQKKWFAADEMLGVLTKSQGQVLEGVDTEGKFRPLEEGLEMDIDFDNTEAITEFIKTQNKGQ